uniref:Uncharacterized protein n=1 Tax=Candidatus Kentrum sp. FM TaxID=2126340 RepID=A0A450SN02_9GAMM|nr:MAG: hypothetical protein BECKFM1743A_GA0114220_101352 [Candidatus Kentron sp. FM]VFJ55168.1 MAG: hypothetical protein BECKFM1743C_GA0114222_101524 [Candidatus Kentron sp. FM]VFK09210.1 MAG: hypothetical protein BECKFM1743B_GA0114221_100985 [Candidatus Kentron sp. FM]
MKALKIILWICAIGFALAFPFAALPWPVITGFIHWVGIVPPDAAAPPITVFMFRLALVTFGMIGIFFAILARNPLGYGPMLVLAAYGLVGYGVFCLVGSIGYGLPVLAFSGDVAFGIVAGLLLLVFRKKALHE